MHKKAKAPSVIEMALRRAFRHVRGFCVDDDSTAQSVLFPDLFSKSLVARFDQGHGSSDGGALLLKAVRAARPVAGAGRMPGRPASAGQDRHEIEELLRQRTFGIACGYADGNDAARLADDPMHKLLAGRDPIAGEALASQPTLSRFENGVRRADLFRMADTLAETVLGHHRRRLRAKARRRSRSTWTRPMIRPTASRSSPSTTATTTAGASCPCWRSSPSTTSRSSTWWRRCFARATCPGLEGRDRDPAAAAQGCGRPFRRRGCGCAWTAALRRPRSSSFWKPNAASTWWRWPRTSAWRRAGKRLMGTARRLSRRSGRSAPILR